LKSFDSLLAKHPDNGQLIFGKALLMQQDGDAEGALKLLEKNPPQAGEIAPMLLRARLLQSLNRGDEALPLLKKSISKYPDDKRLAPDLCARWLSKTAWMRRRCNSPAWSSNTRKTTNCVFLWRWCASKAKPGMKPKGTCKTLIARDSHVDSAHLNLGRIAEERNDPQGALIEYAQVGPGNDYSARTTAPGRHPDQPRSRHQKLEKRLAAARDEQPDYAIQLFLIEAETLSANNQTDRAWNVLQQALLQYPDDLNLLYSRAMQAEKRNDLPQMEKDLRAIIKREPDNAMALNALGYTLSDRTTRYAEAKALINRLMTQPGRPGRARQPGLGELPPGQFDEAERLLRQALERFPDQEVAAHLGEVLWANGKQREARQIWGKFLKEQPRQPYPAQNHFAPDRIRDSLNHVLSHPAPSYCL
jgi:tetratricopeptide (TPR) repeat protein